MTTTPPLTQRRIFFFWLPLAATWLMMSVEGPFLAALIARLPDPKLNLAAFGVAFSFGLIIEAPVIMMMSASTALVKDRQSYLALRNFAHLLNGLVTAAMLVLLAPPVFGPIAENLIGLTPDLARRTHIATLILLPWPGFIGVRRFYQGLLIRHDMTRRVAYGTVIRLAAMGFTGFSLYTLTGIDGAWIGSAALSVGVIVEAAASRVLAHSLIRSLMSNGIKTSGQKTGLSDEPLTFRSIFSFYHPLAVTMILALGVHPLSTFFVGNSRAAIESLAVLPVINSLGFVFRSLGLAYQEVGIALFGDRGEGYQQLRRFALTLSLAAGGGLLVIAFTPLASVWFHHVSGLSWDLTRFAIPPLRIIALIPALTVILSFQRAVLVHFKATAPLTWATVVEVAVIVAVMAIGIFSLNMVGAVAAMAALMIGRVGANLYLIKPVRRLLKNRSVFHPGIRDRLA